MATQTRRTTQRSAKFHSATIKAYIGVACCGLVLLSAVSSHAAVGINGLSVNGLSVNGISSNALTSNGLASNGVALNGLTANGEPPPAIQGKSLPFHGLSQKALGKTQPNHLGLPSLCLRYQLVPPCI